MCFAAIEVEYRDGSSEIISVVEIKHKKYFKVSELNKVFFAQINRDILEQRLYINIYNKQLIFLLESSFVSYADNIYNFKYPLINKEEQYYLPVVFLKYILPKIFKKEIEYKNNKILAKNPVDNRLKRVVLDAGHGGKDPGAVGYSQKNYEKNVVLKIVKKLKKSIEKNLDVEVILTRQSDKFIPLKERTEIANKHNAGLFISVHCNAHRKKSIKGLEVFFLSTAKTDAARTVESLENSVVYDYEGGKEAIKRYNKVDYILADMAQSEQLEESYKFAKNLQNKLIENTKAIDRGVKQANFYVLNGAYMPAVLIETGFISNKEEEKKLISNNYQNRIAEAIYSSIKHFKYQYDNMR